MPCFVRSVTILFFVAVVKTATIQLLPKTWRHSYVHYVIDATAVRIFG